MKETDHEQKDAVRNCFSCFCSQNENLLATGVKTDRRRHHCHGPGRVTDRTHNCHVGSWGALRGDILDSSVRGGDRGRERETLLPAGPSPLSGRAPEGPDPRRRRPEDAPNRDDLNTSGYASEWPHRVRSFLREPCRLRRKEESRASATPSGKAGGRRGRRGVVTAAIESRDPDFTALCIDCVPPPHVTLSITVSAVGAASVPRSSGKSARESDLENCRLRWVTLSGRSFIAELAAATPLARGPGDAWEAAREHAAPRRRAKDQQACACACF
ncbi:hypothetical protein SKAU_G00125390 [Synaphobranchus kaupii]|uniref:Uncharacterized protein n=1 Tax=Synaphobranchus kaupii TaxID=118154 RepID=A0A9Q1J2U6_SYNKA|nr:hypothetical protein SKAU_G00125390 [Synaphobranchus kaupii]